MVNVQTVIASVTSGYGLAIIGFVVKQGISKLRQKLGDKKFNRVVNDCRIAVNALWDAKEQLGIDKLERTAVKQVLGNKKYKNLQVVEEAVKKVISSMDSMVDEPHPQPTGRPTEQQPVKDPQPAEPKPEVTAQ